MNKRETGKQYEQIAAKYLISRGYRIIETNYVCKCGEVDIIAREGSYIVFIEVKYRRNPYSGSGFDAVDMRKCRKISLCMKYYIMERGLSDIDIRCDVVSIDGNKISICTNAFYCEA